MGEYTAFRESDGLSERIRETETLTQTDRDRQTKRGGRQNGT